MALYEFKVDLTNTTIEEELPKVYAKLKGAPIQITIEGEPITVDVKYFSNEPMTNDSELVKSLQEILTKGDRGGD